MTAPADDRALDDVLDAVAAAVDLREGPEGVRATLHALARADRVSNKDLSRAVSMPIPIVVSILNELRTHGLVARTRPAELTDAGRRLLGDARFDAAGIEALCAAVRADLEGGDAPAPPADVAIDQSHSTVETKVARLALMLERGYLPARRLALIGDDDLMSLTVALAGRHAGRALAEEITVVDIDRRVLDHLGRSIGGLASADAPAPRLHLVEHDLREPLPASVEPADVAMTDPPYTVAGARLFLTRALEAVRRRPGQHVLFSFGAKPAAEQLEVQRALGEMGLAVTELRRNFNRYEGAGSLGGVSHLYDLVIGEVAERDPETYRGRLYTAEFQVARDRWYRCAACSDRVLVGPGGRFAEIGALREQGCPNCAGTSFRPESKERTAE